MKFEDRTDSVGVGREERLNIAALGSDRADQGLGAIDQRIHEWWRTMP